MKSIAARIAKSYQTVYREIARNRKPDGRYQPWYAHGLAHQRRQRTRPRRVEADAALRAAIAGQLDMHWSPAQISWCLRRRWPRRKWWHLCHETIYESIYRGLIVVAPLQTLRSGRIYRHKRGRGRSRDGALKQSTNMKSIQDTDFRSAGGGSEYLFWKYTPAMTPTMIRTTGPHARSSSDFRSIRQTVTSGPRSRCVGRDSPLGAGYGWKRLGAVSRRAT